MSRWSDQFNNHQIHSSIQTLQGWLDVEVEEIDAEHEDERRRFKKCLEMIASAVDGQDPELSPENLLTNLDNQLRQGQIWNQIQGYSSKQNIQNLRNANDYLTSQLPLIHQIAAYAGPPETSKTVSSVENAYSDFCKAIEKAERDFKESLSDNEGRLVQIKTELAQQETSLENLKSQSDATFREWQNEFGESQNSRAEEFSSVQIQRAEKYDETMREIRTKAESEADEISMNHEARLKKTFEQFTSKAQQRIDDMKAKHAAILEIHGLVGTDGVAGGYQKTATDEHNTANTWRIVAMLALGLAAAWLLLKFFLGLSAPSAAGLNWTEFVTAGSLTLVLLAAAGYASKQSKSHRDLEQQMRWFSLEVKAIDPFLSSLDEADQKELKKQLSERLFGKDRTAAQAKSSGMDVGTYKELSESILSPVQEIIKSIGKSQ